MTAPLDPAPGDDPQNPPPVGDPAPPAPPEPPDPDPKDPPEAFDEERARAALAKKNSENQSLRKRMKELEKFEKAAKEAEDAKKSEIERATEKATEAERRAQEAELRALRLEVAGEKGLTAVQAKRLVGSTKEELEEDADELLASFAPKTTEPKLPAKPKESLRGGGDPTEEPEETDPRKLAALISRGF